MSIIYIHAMIKQWLNKATVTFWHIHITAVEIDSYCAIYKLDKRKFEMLFLHVFNKLLTQRYVLPVDRNSEKDNLMSCNIANQFRVC